MQRRGLRGSRPMLRRWNDLLASSGMTIDDVQARALELKLETIDRLDRLTTSAEIRRSEHFSGN